MSHIDPEEERLYRRRYYLKNKEKLKAKRKHYYQRNKDQIRAHAREYSRNYRLRMKIEVLNHYGSKCSCCGESRIEFLCPDHVNNDGAEHRRKTNSGSGSKFIRWLINNNYPGGFRTLCHNCNMSIGAYGYCPHQKRNNNDNKIS